MSYWLQSHFCFNTVSNMTRDICSLVEAPRSLPVQGGLESTTGYSIYSSRVRRCDQFQPIYLGGKMWVVEGTSYWRNFNATLRNIWRNFYEIVTSQRRRRYIWKLHPYDVTGRPIYDETATLQFCRRFVVMLRCRQAKTSQFRRGLCRPAISYECSI